MRAKGRYWVAFWLIYSLGILAWVVARQTAAVVLAGRLREIRNDRSALEARRTELLGRIRVGRSRATLIPRALKMGLEMPADSEITIIRVPDPDNR